MSQPRRQPRSPAANTQKFTTDGLTKHFDNHFPEVGLHLHAQGPGTPERAAAKPPQRLLRTNNLSRPAGSGAGGNSPAANKALAAGSQGVWRQPSRDPALPPRRRRPAARRTLTFGEQNSHGTEFELQPDEDVAGMAIH